MPKQSSKPKKKAKKLPGHYCWACGCRRANEKFSGKGHARHICRECVSEQRAAWKRENEMKQFGSAYLANRKRIAVELPYDNWQFFLWKEEFDGPVDFEPYDNYDIYDYEWGADQYESYVGPYDDSGDDNSFHGGWSLLIEATENADRGILRRFWHYLETARMLAECLAPFPEVRKIVLFGEFALPPSRVPNPAKPGERGPFHLPRDLDLALWISSAENLTHMRRLRAKIVDDRSNKKIMYSAERFRLHLFDAATSEYMGRLCTHGSCPGKQPDCQNDGCGQPAFVKPFSELALAEHSFDARNCQTLFERKKARSL